MHMYVKLQICKKMVSVLNGIEFCLWSPWSPKGYCKSSHWFVWHLVTLAVEGGSSYSSLNFGCMWMGGSVCVCVRVDGWVGVYACEWVGVCVCVCVCMCNINWWECVCMYSTDQMQGTCIRQTRLPYV